MMSVSPASSAADARARSPSVIAAAIWIAAAMTDGDRARASAAEDAGETLIMPHGAGSRFKLRFAVPTPEAYHQYYNVISNPLLWFLQHYLWDTPRSPDITHETW